MLSFKEITLLEKSKKARDEQGLFVAEGKKLFSEAPRDRIVQIVMTRSFAKEHPDILDAIPEDVAVAADLEEGRFRSLSDTKTPQGILTVMRKMEWKTDAFLHGNGGKGTCVSPGEEPSRRAPLYCILENLQDPGNAGTILRTGEAAGVTAVFLTEGSVDLYSPKVIRSTMGSIFRVPHFVVSAESAAEDLKAQGIRVYAAHLKGRRSYTDCDYRNGAAFVIGNESRGISPELSEKCSELIRIPMQGQVESLNAAMAAGILMFEAARQR